MADKLKAMQVVNEWIIEYAVYRFWKEFEETQKTSEKWKDVIHGLKAEFLDKVGNDSPIYFRVLCGAFIGQVAKENSVPDSEKNETHCISPKVLGMFEKVMELYPFSVAEKNHMRSTLKAQVVLSSLRLQGKKEAEKLFCKLFPYSAEKEDEEYEENLREVFQNENESVYKSFLLKNSYDRFLKKIIEFMKPVWNSFDVPFLEEEAEAVGQKQGRITGRFVKEVFLNVHDKEDGEELWKQVLQQKLQDQRNLRSTSEKVKDLLTTATEAARNLKKSSDSLLKEHKKREQTKVADTEESSETEDETFNLTEQKRKSTRLRWNTHHPSAEKVEWSDEDDIDINHKKIVLPELNHRVLNVKLPKKRNRKRNFWSEQEVEFLQEGVRKFGAGNWSEILKHYNFNGRTSVNLKDKWRNISSQ